MPDITDTKISEAVAAITEPTPRDSARLLDIAGDIRQQIAQAKVDPKHPAFGNAAAIAAMEQGIAITMARANVQEPAFDPKTAAQAQHDEAFSQREMNANLAEMVDQRIAEITERHSERTLAEMAGGLRTRLGSVTYEKMLADATASLEPGKTLPPAVKADEVTLKLYAARGQYKAAYERTRPKF